MDITGGISGSAQEARVGNHAHPYLMAAVDNYANLLQAMGYPREQIIAELHKVIPEIFQQR